MSTLQTILPLLKEAINDVQQAQSMNSADRKALAVSFINKLVTASNLPQQEQELLNTVLPLLVNDIEVVETEVKGCFSWLKKKV